MDIIEESLNILRINSVSQTGNLELVDYLARLLDKLGLPYEIQSTTHRGVPQQNLICRIEGSSSEEILFNTHLDTVSPGDPKKWHTTGYDPFSPRIEGDKIYGLGSADTKLDFLCKLKALIKHRNEKFMNPLTFVGTYGEEMGLVGCHFFLSSGYVKPKYAFVGEPTELNLVYAHKGMVVIRIEIPLDGSESVNPNDSSLKTLEYSGESAHGSTPHLGESAIKKGLIGLNRLSNKEDLVFVEGGSAVNMVPIDMRLLVAPVNGGENKKRLMACYEILSEIEEELFEDTDYDYDPAYSVMNIGTIRTEKGMAQMRLAVRMLPKRDFSAVNRKLEERIGSIGGRVVLERDQPAMYTSREGFLVRKSLEILGDLNIPSQAITKPTSTEAAHYVNWGAQAVVFGPGISTNNIHKPNEYNLIPQLYEAVSFYNRVIEEFCLSEIR